MSPTQAAQFSPVYQIEGELPTGGPLQPVGSLKLFHALEYLDFFFQHQTW